MKQKIVIKVQVHCDRCRSKAMSVASQEGVGSITIEGADRDQLVVVGEGVDSVDLTKKLRKKLGHAKIISVQEVKEEKKEEGKEKEENKEDGKEKEEKKEDGKEKEVEPRCPCPYYQRCQCRPVMYTIVEDANPSCSVM